jgi:hypothetical protein
MDKKWTDVERCAPVFFRLPTSRLHHPPFRHRVAQRTRFLCLSFAVRYYYEMSTPEVGTNLESVESAKRARMAATKPCRALNPRRPLEQNTVWKMSGNLLSTYKVINQRWHERWNEQKKSKEMKTCLERKQYIYSLIKDVPSNNTLTRVVGDGATVGVGVGYTDDDFGYCCLKGEQLGQYRVEGQIGRGMNGRVLHCKDTKNQTSVAIKVASAKRGYASQAWREITIMNNIQKYAATTNKPDRAKRGLSNLLDWFLLDRHTSNKLPTVHICLVLPLGSISLYELLRQTQFQGTETRFLHLILILNHLNHLNHEP